MTEDEGPDGFYRFVPDTPGEPRSRRQLQMLRVQGPARYNTIVGQTVGDVLAVQLGHDRQPGPRQRRGQRLGGVPAGSREGRREVPGRRGCTYRDGGVVFGSSDGGDAGLGQVWQYTPTNNIGKKNEEGELVLLFESTGVDARRPGQHVRRAPAARSSSPRTATSRATSCGRCCPTARLITIAENLVARAAALHRGVGQALRPDGSRRRCLRRRRDRASPSSRVRRSARTASGCSSTSRSPASRARSPALGEPRTLIET